MLQITGCEVLAVKFCIACWHWEFPETSHDSLLSIFVFPHGREKNPNQKKNVQVKEIRWEKWNYELCKERGCWVPLSTSNPEVLIWHPGKLLEHAVRYVFVLNAKWLCDRYLMKATHDTLSGSTLFFAVEHVKQPLKSVSLLVLFVIFWKWLYW